MEELSWVLWFVCVFAFAGLVIAGIKDISDREKRLETRPASSCEIMGRSDLVGYIEKCSLSDGSVCYVTGKGGISCK